MTFSSGHKPLSSSDSKKLDVPRRLDKLETLKRQVEERKYRDGPCDRDYIPDRDEVESMRRSMLS